MTKVYWNDYLIKVLWDGYNEDNKIDVRNQILFEETVSNYLATFKTLPPKGLELTNYETDIGVVELITFGERSIYVHVEF